MKKTISATEARKQFFKLIELAGKPGSSVTITLEGRSPVIIMSQEEYDGWLETLEIMSDPELMADIRKGMKEVEEGKVVDWEDVSKELNL